MYFIMLSSSIGYFSSISAYYLSIDIDDFSEFNKYLKSIDKQVLFDSNFTSLRVERSMNSSQYTSDIEHAKCKLVYGFEFEKKCEPKTYFHTIDKFLILGEFYIIGICEASNSYFDKLLKDSNNKYCKMYKSGDKSGSILAPIISYEGMRYVFNKKLDKVYYNSDNSFSLVSSKGKEYRWG